MQNNGNKRWGNWAVPGQTQTAGTVIAALIRPFRGPGGSPPFRYSAGDGTHPNWNGQPITKVTLAGITSGSTAHTWYFLRPKNWTTTASVTAANATTVVMTDNPGTYSTNYKYALPPGEAPGVGADNTPASGDYCALQLDDGTWHLSLISSLSGLTLTIATAVPNISGGGAAAGSVLFFFGAGGDVDPATGQLDPCLLPNVSTYTAFAEPGGLISAIHPGDPLVVVNANASNASTLAALCGCYDKAA